MVIFMRVYSENGFAVYISEAVSAAVNGGPVKCSQAAGVTAVVFPAGRALGPRRGERGGPGRFESDGRAYLPLNCFPPVLDGRH